MFSTRTALASVPVPPDSTFRTSNIYGSTPQYTVTDLGLQIGLLSGSHCEQQADAELWDTIPLAEVKKHCSIDSLWVTYKGCVYDVTQFLAIHPGGIDLLSTAGGLDLEPFWETYGVHDRGNTAHTYLESYKIGVLSAEDQEQVA